MLNWSCIPLFKYINDKLVINEQCGLIYDDLNKASFNLYAFTVTLPLKCVNMEFDYAMTIIATALG